MAAAEFDPQPLQAYASLDKAGAAALLDAVDDAIDALEADPGAAAVGTGRSATDCGAFRSGIGRKIG